MTSKLKLGELLVQAGVIDSAQLQAALGEQRQWGKPLGMTLVAMGMLDEDTLVQTLASQLKVPVVKLTGKSVNPEVLARVPHELAAKHRCIPLLQNDEGGQNVLYLGMEDPSDLDAIDAVTFRAGGKIKPVLVAPGELDDALARHAREGWGAAPDGPRAEAVVDSDLEGARFADDSFRAASAPVEFAEPEGGAASATQLATQTAILRALSQLLVEKGVITRDEFVERVRVAMGESEGD